MHRAAADAREAQNRASRRHARVRAKPRSRPCAGTEYSRDAGHCFAQRVELVVWCSSSARLLTTERCGISVSVSEDPAVTAFCFSIDHGVAKWDDPYSEPERTVIGVLAEHAADVRSLVTSGHLLLPNLATKIGAIRGDGRPDHLGAVTRTTVESFDGALHTTLVWDLCDAIADQRYDGDLKVLAHALLKHDVCVITATALSDDQVITANQQLGETLGYLGSLSVDLGDPVQHRIMSLPRVCYLLDGVLVLHPWDTDSPFDPHPLDDDHPDPWWHGLPLASVRYTTDEEMNDAHALPSWPPATLSERGAQTAAMLARLTAPSHLDRLAAEMAGRRDVVGPWPFEIDTAVMPHAADAIIEPAKLAGYALDLENETGRHKARLFRDLLGITADDADFLAAQLKQGLTSAGSLIRVRTSQWGVKYHVVVDVRGRNGKVYPVVAAWEVRDGQPPRLTTTYLADKGTPSDASGVSPTIDPALTGDDRWASLWHIADEAGRRAAATCFPTATSVDGEWIAEGLDGGGTVRVHDARIGFARWLRRHGHARDDGQPGATISSPGRSLYCGKAYANAFADMLALNGIEARVGEFFL